MQSTMRILSIKTVAHIKENFSFEHSSCYLWNVSSFFCLTPTCDVTLGTTGEVTLRQTHRPHAHVVGEWRPELNESQVIIRAEPGIVWVFDYLFDWYILLVAFFSIQVMISCYNKNTSKIHFKSTMIHSKKGNRQQDAMLGQTPYLFSIRPGRQACAINP